MDVGEGGEPETSLCKAYSSFAVIDKFAVNSVHFFHTYALSLSLSLSLSL